VDVKIFLEPSKNNFRILGKL